MGTQSNGRGQRSSQAGGGQWDQDELAQQFSRLARSLQGEQDTSGMLAELVQQAVALIPGTDEASISVVSNRETVSSLFPTGDLPEKLDAAQTELGEGPCLDAFFAEQTVRVDDLASEQRWPRFAEVAAAAGAASMLAFQLYVEGDNLGALNLFSRRPGAFDDESEHVGLLFASHAAVALADAQKFDQLLRAIDTRDLIGQAKGILMERFDLTADEAFSLLLRLSSTQNRKLRDLAGELTDTRRLPGS